MTFSSGAGPSRGHLAHSGRTPGTQVSAFAASDKYIGPIDAMDAARLMTAVSDIALVIDGKGAICDLATGIKEFGGHKEFLGRRWIETVTIESRPKVEQLLNEVESAYVSKSREINQILPNGQEWPLRFSAVRLGKSGRVIALGRDLSAVSELQQQLVEAQRSAEREYLRLRSSETRYRILFQTSHEAILIVDANNLRSVDANPAAAALLESTSGKLVGRAFIDVFDAASRAQIEKHFEDLRGTGRIEAARAKLTTQRECWVSASLFRHDDGAQILVRLTPVVGTGSASVPAVKSQALKIIESLPDAFVVVDLERRILDANAAFLETTELPSIGQARGQPIDRWLGRNGVDVNVMFSNLRDHGSVRGFATVIRNEYGATEDVEVAGVSVPAGDKPCYGLVIHTVGQRPQKASMATGNQARSAEQLSELIGRVPLKELVRETTEITERLCIEASLKITGDNRAAAAQMLGLSRQSLYGKLRRYDIGGLGDDEDD